MMYSIDQIDWDPATTQQDILNRVSTSPKLKPGAIALLRAGGQNMPAALDALIDGQQRRVRDRSAERNCVTVHRAHGSQDGSATGKLRRATPMRVSAMP